MAAGQRLISSVYNNCGLGSLCSAISDIVPNLGVNVDKSFWNLKILIKSSCKKIWIQQTQLSLVKVQHWGCIISI